MLDLDYRIEPMQVEQLDDIMAIEKVSFPTPWSRNAFLGELQENDFARYYVCLVDQRVIAYAGMWIIMDEAHITNIAVAPQFRGNHLGRVMLLTLMREAISFGSDKITLEVRPSNAVARELYRSMGFVPAGIRKGYYSDTREDAIIMWRHLYKSNYLVGEKT
ncbi:MAG: ribosomal protein S18-alanine N-acetyltransferase [Bacillota bacterium]